MARHMRIDPHDWEGEYKPLQDQVRFLETTRVMVSSFLMG